MSLAQKLELNQIERDALILYCLTHDIGHLPNSHVTEPLLRMFERKYKFHEALGRYKLRQDRTIREWCSRYLGNGEQVWGKLVKLWGNEVGIGFPLSELFHCIINVDLVEGIWRSCKILEVPCPAREDVFLGFHRSRDRIAIEYDKNRIDILKRFWDSQSVVYQNFVFSIVNQAAEAMWKKALFYALNEHSLDVAASFLQAKDSDIIPMIAKCNPARQLLELLGERRCLKPVWIANESFIWNNVPKFYKDIANVCDTIEKYQQFEKTLFEILNYKRRNIKTVAIHFTRYRRFHIRWDGQLQLFNPLLSELSSFFIAKKTPGLVVSGVFAWPPIPVSELKNNLRDLGCLTLHSDQLIESISNSATP